MAVTRTNVRTYHDVAIGRRFQDAKGSAATPTTFMKECDFTPNPGVLIFDPQGTHGSIFKLKQGVRPVYNEPTMTIAYWLSRETAQFLENFLGGLNTSSGAQLSSTCAHVTSTTLSGIRFPDCMESPTESKFTLEIAANAGNWDITCWKDAAKTIKMSEQINLAGGGTVLTVKQAGYSLVMGGTLGAVPIAGDYYVTVKQYTCVWAARPHAAAYQTIAVDTGLEKFTFVDCWTKSFEFTPSGRTGIRVTEEIIAMTMVPAATTLTAAIIDESFLAARDLTLTYDAAADNYSLPVEGGMTMRGEWDTSSGPDNAANPEFHDRDEIDMTVKTNMKWTDELKKIMENARAGTSKTLTVDYSYGAFGLSFAFPYSLPDPNLLPTGSGKRMEPQELNLSGRADGAATPVTLCVVNVDLVA